MSLFLITLFNSYISLCISNTFPLIFSFSASYLPQILPSSCNLISLSPSSSSLRTYIVVSYSWSKILCFLFCSWLRARLTSHYMYFCFNSSIYIIRWKIPFVSDFSTSTGTCAMFWALATRQCLHSLSQVFSIILKSSASMVVLSIVAIHCLIVLAWILCCLCYCST